MVDTEIVVFVVLMLLLFFRQFFIYRQASKINYAPIILMLGSLGALLHVLMHGQRELDTLFRHSLIPLTVSIVLYIIINILNQTQQRKVLAEREAFQEQLLREMDMIKQDIVLLSEREYHLDRGEHNDTETLQQRLHQEIDALHHLQTTQDERMRKLETILHKYYRGVRRIEEFFDTTMPEFDTIIHRHIEILRITEQEHFNRVVGLLDRHQESYATQQSMLQHIQREMTLLNERDKKTATAMIEKTTAQLYQVADEFKKQMYQLQASAKIVQDDLNMNAARFKALEEEGEGVLQKIVVLSKKVDAITTQADTLLKLEHSVEKVLQERRHIVEEREVLQEEIKELKEMLIVSKKDQNKLFKALNEEISRVLNERMQSALDQLHEHYFALQGSHASTLKELASRSKIEKTYRSNSS